MTTTTEPTTTIRISMGSAALTLRRPDTLSEGDRANYLASVDAVLNPQEFTTATGTDYRWLPTGGLRALWMNLIVDVHGVPGYDCHEFTREGLDPARRLAGMAARPEGPENPGHHAAANLLATLADRSAAAVLRAYLTSSITSIDECTTAGHQLGSFIGYGCTGVAQGGREWIVDPNTGCITAPVAAAVASI